MKRFNNNRAKITTPVTFPLENLDMASFSCHNQVDPSPVYDLFGISNHSGTSSSGHYTAICKNATNGKWYCFNDSHVSEVQKDYIGKDGMPYVLFYKRRDFGNNKN